LVFGIVFKSFFSHGFLFGPFVIVRFWMFLELCTLSFSGFFRRLSVFCLFGGLLLGLETTNQTPCTRKIPLNRRGASPT
jgi:hypothetical protein